MKGTFILYCLAISLLGHAQKNRLDSLFAASAPFPVETVYLHCTQYLASGGDTIFWAAYIFENDLPSTISTNLYVELFSKDRHLIVERLFPIVGGLSIGQLAIPDSL